MRFRSNFNFLIVILINLFWKYSAIPIQKRWALINVTSVTLIDNDEIKNILFTDSALYSLYSPVYPVNSRLIEVQSIDTKVNDSNKNQTISNLGCSDYINQNLPDNYIALVSRGVCPFEQKVQVAIANKASAIIIYNNDLDVFTMYIKNSSIPSVMVSEYVGNLLRKLLKYSTVYVLIKPGPVEYVPSSSLPSKTSIYFVAFAFLSVVLVTFVWLTVYYVQKFRYLNTKKKLDDRLKKATLKALSKMVVRKISNEDKELTETCAICLENYQANDQIRELPCGHYFHQKDVDIWLLEHRNCPMCKINILQACGIEFQGPESLLRRFLINMRPRGLFRNSAVETSNETVQNVTSPEVSLQSISNTTNLSNFQVSQARSDHAIENEDVVTVEDVTNSETNDTINLDSKSNQNIVINKSITSNQQNEKNSNHSNGTNEINV